MKGAVLDTLSFAAVVRSVVPASVSILIELIQVEQIVTTPEDLIMQEHYLNVWDYEIIDIGKVTVNLVDTYTKEVKIVMVLEPYHACTYLIKVRLATI